MPLPALVLFALAYSGLVLFGLAHAFRKLYPPGRAAWTAFGLSALVHGATVFLAEPERRLPLTLFWLLPHLLWLPVLLMAARQQHSQNLHKSNASYARTVAEVRRGLDSLRNVPSMDREER